MNVNSNKQAALQKSARRLACIIKSVNKRQFECKQSLRISTESYGEIGAVQQAVAQSSNNLSCGFCRIAAREVMLSDRTV
jgi:hypothetical protein